MLLILCFVTGPFGVLDETEHFLRAAAIARGQVVPLASTDRANVHRPIAGGYVDVQVADIAAEQDYRQRFRVATQPTFRFDVGLIEIAMRRLPSGRIVFSEHNNTALYPPVLYLGAALADEAGQLMSLPVLSWLYLGRFVNAIMVGAIMFCAIRSAPTKRPVFLLYASLPVVLFECASVSADSLMLACFAGFGCLLLRLISSREQSRAEIVAVCVAMCVIAIGKVAYAPLVALPSLLVIARERRVTRQAVIYASSAIFALVIWAAWAMTIHSMVFSMRPGIVVDPKSQLANLAQHPDLFITLARYALVHQAGLLATEAVGHDLGYQTIWIKGWFCLLLILSLLAAALAPATRPALRGTGLAFAGTLVFCAICSLAVYALIYVQFNPVGASVVDGVQGRYFLPLILLVLALAPPLGGRKLGAVAPVAVTSFVAGLSIVSAFLTCGLVLNRFWL